MIVIGVKWNNPSGDDMTGALSFQLRHHPGRVVVCEYAVTMICIPNAVCTGSASEIEQQAAWRHSLSHDLMKRIANPRIARMLCHRGVVLRRKAIVKTRVFLQV